MLFVEPSPRQLLLLARLDDTCWVADARGVYVRVDCSGLREL